MNSQQHASLVATRSSRRQFLRAVAVSVPAITWGTAHSTKLFATPIDGAATPGSVTAISEHLLVFHGPVHVGIIRDGDRALIIDCGDGRVQEILGQHGVRSVAQLVFTHYHRDQLCGAGRFPRSAKRGVPAEEREYFANPSKYWDDDSQLYRVYKSFRPDHLMPTEPLPIDTTYSDGDVFSFGPATIRVVSTPGHTDGAVSYLVEVDGKRVLFCGDLMAGDGQIWDIFSLQKGFESGGRTVGGYHGFMGDRWRLAESLFAAKKCNPDVIIPAHGTLISKPSEAIDHLIDRLETCYENYVSISALRHYFPRLFAQYEGKPGQMPLRRGTKPPECLRHYGTTWMLVSKTGAALVMDVGSNAIVDRLEKMLADKEIKSIDALWVTHYHFDHTNGIVKFQETFDCPCITDKRLADVLEKPAAWRLPCLAPEPIKVHQQMHDGQSWNWHEFKLTSFFYPGQTLYHAALLAESGDLRMLFIGDSHTEGGLDDYCAHNRNFLGRDVGFHYCLSLIEKLQPTHMFNCHVHDAFTFNASEIAFMRKQLDRREELFGQLTPWPHANFGTDPTWIRVDPYRQERKAGQKMRAAVVVMNHSESEVSYSFRTTLPRAWGGATSPWQTLLAAGKAEKQGMLSISVPQNAKPGRYVIPLDLRLGDRELPSFSECIVDVVG